MWPWVIIGEFEVLVVEGEEVLDVRVYLHLGQRTWGAGELQFCLLQVIEVEVGVAGGVNEVAALQPCHLCHHLKEEGVGCDIEGHTKEGVCAALIELQGEFAVSYIELEQTVAGWESHLLYLGGIPCADHDAAGVGIILYQIHALLYLVDGASLVVGP